MPLINEVFGTSYPEDIEIIQKRNEHQTKQGEIITDSHLLILDKAYHIECQSTHDRKLLSVEMIMPDGSVTEYKVPTIYVGHYTKYIMRYEKKVLDTAHPELQKMLEEYREIEKCQEESRKGFGDVIGGKVLELELDK